MAVEIVVPDMGEAGVEATVSRWLKKAGEPVKAGEVVVVLETDKVDLEVAAEADGVLQSIEREEGQDVEIGDVLGRIDAQGAEVAPRTDGKAQEKAPEAEAEYARGGEQAVEKEQQRPAGRTDRGEENRVTPVAQRIAQENNVDLSKITGSGTQGRVTREDVEKYLSEQGSRQQQEPQRPAAPASQQPQQKERPQPATNGRPDSEGEERVRMSRRRRTIARRLVEAQQTAAMLTTFNDVDMGAVMDLRARRKEAFRERYGVSLGLSAFFVKAAIGALRAFPMLNAEIDGDDIILKHYYDIGVAIGAEEGLVVPVLRNADRMSFATIESAIKQFARQSDDGTLSLDDLRGGTFTITNGGIFGSLLSTPILNPPQVGILGLHRIEDRPVARQGEVVIRPMMYVALSYDHRIVDGREAVQFLAHIKKLIEDPEVLLIEG